MAEFLYSFNVRAHKHDENNNPCLLGGRKEARGQNTEHAKAKLLGQLVGDGWEVDEVSYVPTLQVEPLARTNAASNLIEQASYADATHRRIDPLTSEDISRMIRAEIDRVAESLRNSTYVHFV